MTYVEGVDMSGAWATMQGMPRRFLALVVTIALVALVPLTTAALAALAEVPPRIDSR